MFYTIFRSPYWCTTEVHQYGVFILGSVNFCETFRRISEVWGDAQAYNLEKCLIFLSSITSQFRSFFHWIGFNLFFLLRDNENDLSALGKLTTIPINLAVKFRRESPKRPFVWLFRKRGVRSLKTNLKINLKK